MLGRQLPKRFFLIIDCKLLSMKLTVLPTFSAFLDVGVGSKSPLTLQASSLVVVSPLLAFKKDEEGERYFERP